MIFYIDENDKWNLLIGNVNNLCKDIEMKKSTVEILANSEVVKIYKNKIPFILVLKN